ncbi:sigma 54-interacting transcriptional regulator, partial [bacterium]|nr:sigma 54-interacting transcriptional regulator [bacterium]
ELEKIKITHGDLKSDNILVVGNCVKIIDFGFAQTITEKLNSAFVSGTLEYTAPEKFKDGKITTKSDVYSIGVLFLELLLGFNPFSGATASEIIEKQLSFFPEPLQNYKPELDTFWLKVIPEMIEKNPETRISASEILSFFLENKENVNLELLLEEYKNEQNVYTKRENFLKLYENLKSTDLETPALEKSYFTVAQILSEIFFRLGNYEETIRFSKEALKFADEKNTIEFNCLIGFCDWALGNLESSQKTLEFARTLSSNSYKNKNHYLGQIEKHLGNLFCKFFDYSKAFEHYNTALSIFIAEKNIPERFAVLGNLGRLCSEVFDFEKALNYFNQVKDYFEQIENFRQLSTTLLNIAVINTQVFKFAEAKRNVEKALQLHQKHGLREESTKDWLMLGYLCSEIGDFGNALKFLQNALEEYTELNDLAGTQTAKIYLAQTCNKIGDFEKASNLIFSETKFLRKDLELEFLQEKIRLKKLLSHDEIAEGLNQQKEANLPNLEIDFKILQAEFLFQNKDFAQAKKILGEVLKSSNKIFYVSGQVKATFVLSEILQAEGFWNEAYKVLKNAVSIVENESYYFADVLFFHFGKIQKQIFYPDADFYLEKSLEEFERISISIGNERLKNIFRESRQEFFSITKNTSSQSEKRKDFRRTEDEYYYHLGLLMEINKSINSELDPKKVLKLIMEKMILITDADKGFIMIINSETQKLEFSQAYGFENEPLDLENNSELSTTITLEVYKTGNPYFENHAVDSGNFTPGQSVKRLKIRSVICVPLKNKKAEIIGVLYVHSQTEGKHVSELKKNLLIAMADQVSIAIENSQNYQILKEEVEFLKTEINHSYKNLIGQSPKMKKVFYIIDKVASGDSNIFILGESGTGKEVVARAIHFSGERKNKPFIAVDCGALPENLLESELFGHKKGAFTGAYEDRKGVFEEAENGTIFLDEITNTSLAFQSRLLRVLQEKEVRRLGENTPRKINVRVIAATNLDIKKAVQEEKFREDLFYRLYVVPIELPPVRERVEDIPILIQHFLEKFNKQNNTKKTISKDAVSTLQTYNWEGNVRQLENIIEQIAIFSDDKITTKDIPDFIKTFKTTIKTESLSAKGEILTLEELQKRHIKFVLSETNGKMSKAAELLGMNRSTLYKRMEILGMR